MNTKKVMWWLHRYMFVVTLASHFLIMYLFVSAYGSPDYQVTIDINAYGEAGFEMVLILTTVIALPSYIGMQMRLILHDMQKIR